MVDKIDKFGGDNIIIGIELNKWSPNGNNGNINKHKYFQCKNGFGYFIHLKYVNKNDKNDNNLNRLSVNISSTLKVGDKVKLTGIVKYIGETDFTKGETDYTNGHLLDIMEQ